MSKEKSHTPLSIEDIDKMETVVTLKDIGFFTECLGDLICCLKELISSPIEAKENWDINAEIEHGLEVHSKIDSLFSKRLIKYYEENNLPVPEYLYEVNNKFEHTIN